MTATDFSETPIAFFFGTRSVRAKFRDRDSVVGDMTTAREVNPILVIDRNPEKRERLCRILASEGHQVIGADDATSAVVASRAHRPSLLLLDSVLPGIDGETVLHAMRNEMREDTPPAFLLTTSDSEVTRAGKLGAVMSFRKPFAVEDLLVAVRGFLDRLSASPT